ncbi:MAG: hypothetical protein JWN48_3799 [Myxococcaceae bacterium]|nr:hypothetical protein [Myxococcaceae bacterium]
MTTSIRAHTSEPPGPARLNTAPSLHADEEDLASAQLSDEAPIEAANPRSLKYSLMLLGMSAVWGVLISQFGQGQIYWIMGPYAAVISIVLLTLRSRALLALMRPTLKNVGIGVAVGTAMTLATYPAFALAKQFFPELARNVSELYSKSNDELLITALLWVAVIAAAEDLLWRGAWIEALTPRFGRLYAGVLSVVLYAGTQLCCKSFIVGLLALCCGTIWTIQRHYTRSVISPLISHLIWTPTVILLVPVV